MVTGLVIIRKDTGQTHAWMFMEILQLIDGDVQIQMMMDIPMQMRMPPHIQMELLMHSPLIQLSGRILMVMDMEMNKIEPSGPAPNGSL